ncbi:MAG TPA: DUF4124 domain-containing protein [Fluviicoccus sp.]|nr:DUF4124 domain-containing protein [Fluviicoccus sp.]
MSAHSPSLRRKVTFLGVITLVAGLGFPAHAGIYRCIGHDDKVAFQDHPCGNAKASQVIAPDTPDNTGSDTASPSGEEARDIPFAPAAAPAAASTPSMPVMEAYPDSRRAPASNQSIKPRPVAGKEDLSRDADVIIVSGNNLSSGKTKVHVNHPARPVLLVLSSYNSTTWKVLPAPGTRIKAVITSSQNESGSVEAPPGVLVVRDDLPYATETENLNFRELLGKLHVRYGVNTVLGFRGGYTLPEVIPVSDPFEPDVNLSLEGVLPEKPKSIVEFDLISTNGQRLPWTNAGPKDGKRHTGIVNGGMMSRITAMAYGKNGREAFMLKGNGGTLLWLPQGPEGPERPLEVPKNLPELSWGCGLAWDSRNGILAMVSFGSEGYFYRYDTNRQLWLDARSLNNKDLLGLTFDSSTNRYVGVTNYSELMIFNNHGETEEILPLKDKLKDLDSTYDRHNSSLRELTVAAARGNQVVLVNVHNGTVTHIWTYDLGKRTAQLTYKLLD